LPFDNPNLIIGCTGNSPKDNEIFIYVGYYTKVQPDDSVFNRRCTIHRFNLDKYTITTEWEGKAMQALTASRDDLAKAALERKALAERNQTDLVPLFEQAKSTTANLRVQLDKLKAKLDEARMRQSTLIARSQAAKAQKQIAQAMSGVGSDAFSKFDKFEQKIEKLEAEAVAFEQLAGENTSLDEQFKQLESSSVDSDLLALKAKMGLLPKSDEN